MKILLIAHSLQGGGSERVFCLLANYLFAQGYPVKIVTLKSGPRNPLPADMPVVELAYSHHFSCVKALRREIKNYNPDVLISFEYYVNLVTILSAWGLNKKIIISERNNPAVVGAGAFKTPCATFCTDFATC